MKIAIFSDNFYPEISGISDSIITTANQLANKGHKINFYVPVYSKKDYEFVKLVPREIKLHKNIKIIRLPSLSFKSTGQGRLVIPTWKILESIKKFKPEVIHVQLPFGAGLEGLLASKIFDIPLIGTNHTPSQELVLNSPMKNSIITKLLLKYNVWFYNNCNVITSPSKAILNEVDGKLERIRKVVLNPVEIYPLDFITNKKDFKKKYNLSEFTIVYCGRLSVPKNIEILIKATAKLMLRIPNINLALIGEGLNEGKLRKLAEKLKVTNSIKFLGYRNKQEIAEIYSASDIFAIMSIESQCLAAMQAMGFSLPVIGVNVGGLAEHLKSINGITVNLHDYNGLAKKIMFLHTHPEFMKKIEEQQKIFIKQFSPSKIAQLWEKIYQRAVKNHREKYQQK